ncbi:NADP-dependent oxidoreductase [Amnibacterium sp. CER49]|uniref:NADP-dependent oxidoreductase n=1 Tax=Amnibacterium sp. CER49 TaxID=3039161 RepID=UPI00244B06CE|nr:NADP-dependent oxidoreductase [Amnibacterium sp. CER49]MDH2444577.1 NADP-dependent oxidoreductase [Amnibacterium sp. CER49]
MTVPTTATSRQWRLVARPVGWPTPDDFRLVEVPLPEPADGEVRVRNEFVSVDPYMRGRMVDAPSYLPPYRLGETMTGGAVGRVVASRAPQVPEGALVLSQWGWRDTAQGPAREVQVLPDPAPLPSSVYLGVLGMTAFAAWVGLVDVAHLAEGETVFVSAAAGAVGSVAGQIARRLGAARVVGSAGGAEKVRRVVEEYGFDAAFDHRDGPARRRLRELAPDGIDVYFDNVGGEQLEAALSVLRRNGRVAMCGAIAGYNTAEPLPGPRNMGEIITKSLTLQGYTVPAYLAGYPAFHERMRGWMTDGGIRGDEWVVDGIDAAVQAFLGMMRGESTGKALVRISR